MINQGRILLIVLMISSCGQYNQFDKLYKNKEFANAYRVLQNTHKENLESFKEREIKVIIHLVISGHNEYLSILDSLLISEPSPNLQIWHDFARSWIRFVSAKTSVDFENVLKTLPKQTLKEVDLEQIRLIIYAHSLLELKEYKRLISYFSTRNISHKNSELLYLQGLTYMKLEDNAKAQQYFQSMIRNTANNQLKALGYFYIGEIVERERKTDLAEKYYLRSWELEPQNAELNLRLGRLIQQKNKYNDLHYRFYRASLRIDKNTAESWYYLNIQ
ncbi:MAG: tetratricopeptide repeat protein [Brevinemataceae bacterium]